MSRDFFSDTADWLCSAICIRCTSIVCTVNHLHSYHFTHFAAYRVEVLCPLFTRVYVHHPVSACRSLHPSCRQWGRNWMEIQNDVWGIAVWTWSMLGYVHCCAACDRQFVSCSSRTRFDMNDCRHITQRGMHAHRCIFVRSITSDSSPRCSDHFCRHWTN